MYSISPNLVELAGFCGLDFCRMDNENARRRADSFEHILYELFRGIITPFGQLYQDPEQLKKQDISLMD